MKAVVHTRYGPPEVAKVMEVKRPEPKENEVLVKVYAATVNRTDAGFRSAEYFISRFWSGLFRPQCQTLGCEFSGVVEQVGSQVTTFKVGDKVFGFNDKTFGGHGEYLTMAEKDAISTMPENLNFYQAAALTEASHYALADIRAAQVKKDQRVLVNGATGAIGSSAVQLLKYFGAHVTAVCGTAHVDLVKSLGADRVIDYQTMDFTKTEDRYDFIFDAVGKSSYKACKPLLTEKGIYISTELGKNGVNVLLALITPLYGSKRLLFPLPFINKQDVEFLKQRAMEGHFRPVIDRMYTMDQIVEAYRYVETGQKIGNVILKIS